MRWICLGGFAALLPGAQAAVPDVYVISTLAGKSTSGVADGEAAQAQFYFPVGVAIDGSGNTYVADSGNATIRKISPNGLVTTLAGKAGETGTANGLGGEARFTIPIAVAVAPGGDLYVGERGGTSLRKISPNGMVSTLAGSPTVLGYADGKGAAARFGVIEGIAVDAAGNLFVADQVNQVIRKVTPDGDVTTFAGTPNVSGSADGRGGAARFNTPKGLCFDAAGNLYVVDNANHIIRKISPAGDVTTLAGTPGVSGRVDGVGASASFRYPIGIAADAEGNLFVADDGNALVRRITPGGTVTTWAGGDYGDHDGVGTGAAFTSPQGIARDAAGNLIVADTGAQRLRKINPTRGVGPFAGVVLGNVDGNGDLARFNYPSGLATDASGRIVVANTFSHTLRRVSLDGAVTTLAGTAGVTGHIDGAGSGATFSYPQVVALDGTGNTYVSDVFWSVIRRITPEGTVSTWAGIGGSMGHEDGDRRAARFQSPHGLAFDLQGNLWVADQMANVLRVISPAGVVRTVAGKIGSDPQSIDGVGEAARFSYPQRLAVDAAGNVFLTENNSHAIRRVTPSGVVTTFAGSATEGGWRDSSGTSARFRAPVGLAFDADGNLVVADSGNYVVRRISPAGVVTTIAGQGGFAGSRDGVGAEALFYTPIDVAFDARGRLLVADLSNGVVRVGVPPVAPQFSSSPAGRTVRVGEAVTFTAAASGLPEPTYQWYFNGEAIGGATGTSYTVPAAQLNQSGSYTVKATNAGGSSLSDGAVLAVQKAAGAPVVAREPKSQTLAAGGTAIFSVNVTETAAALGVGLGAQTATTYQWFYNGGIIAGATGSRLQLSGVALRAGQYVCLIANESGATVSAAATLKVVTAADPGRLVNISFLARAGAGEVMAAGFVMSGNAAMPVLVRAGGPALKALGVSEFAPSPALKLFDATRAQIGYNAGWSGDGAILVAAARLGAYPWGATATPDSALLATLTPGPYTSHIAELSAGAGLALFEVYDATVVSTRTAASPRLVNISSLSKASTANPLTVGFVIAGETSCTVLIRAGGPALNALGVTGYQPTPRLELFAEHAVLLEKNSGWAGDPAIAATAKTVGAQSWGATATADAAVLVTLPPGPYSVIASSTTEASGLVLLEVYEVP